MPVAILVRTARPGDTRGVHRLIARHTGAGQLLPRTLRDVSEHVHRFMVATARGRIVGCAELAPLSPSVAEVRSFVVTSRSRGRGVGRSILDALRARARRRHFEQLCAFTHSAEYFLRLDFQVVSHASVPEKIEADCRTCASFGHCGQYAMVSDLAPMAEPQPHVIALRTLQA